MYILQKTAFVTKKLKNILLLFHPTMYSKYGSPDIMLAEQALKLMTLPKGDAGRKEKITLLRGEKSHTLDDIFTSIATGGPQYGVVINGEARISSFSGCFGGLNARGITNGCTYLFTINKRQQLEDKELRLQLFDYFINESPWSDIIVTKDPDFAFNHGIIIDSNAPGNFVGGALLGWRWIYQCDPQRLWLWKDLVDRKVNKDLVYLLLGFSGGYVRNDLRYVNSINQTTPPFIFRKKFVNGFLNHERVHTTDSYKNLGTYRRIAPFQGDTTVKQTFCSYEQDSKDIAIKFNKSLYNFLEKNGADTPKVSSPFGSSDTITSYSMFNNVDLMAKWAHTHFARFH